MPRRLQKMSEGVDKKLSGAQYKRKRREKQAHIKRHAGSSLNYLQGTRKKEDSKESEFDLDFHKEDVADEINRTNRVALFL
ncbi:hypothetical protein TNCT_155131 [Trichonephila clavata]|uniref:Uncharacterized protein n=1 Tax=Trichonephila clavata TaxID=2740835 RepID=A0A8X6JD21_TRICU|nr:hypothetical protein TNCT_155131 [Trichonephila clavata]